MELMWFSAAVLASALCAGVMGFAIQRGATCTVAEAGAGNQHEKSGRRHGVRHGRRPASG
jgi:hypothetical protein